MKDPAELVKNRKQLVSEMENTYGYIFCQKRGCGKSRSYKFEVHHIVFRSERPDHPMLHDKLNLIIVCSDCHNQKPNSFHNKKDERNYLMLERGLDKIFNISVW